MHEAAARALGIDLHYQLIEIAGANRDTLRTLLDDLRARGFAGVNVTYPYKEAVLALLDDLSPAAAAIGAVNTVVVRDDRLIGHNTDSTGFARAAADAGGTLRNASVALIGAGGVGKAIAFALTGLGVAEVRIFDTDRAKAEHLAMQLQPRGRAVAADSVEAALREAAGLVNATPLGMLPNRESPVPAPLLHRGLWVADAVYHPLWTPLLLAAKATGAQVMTGRELAIAQALDAFELFTGRVAEREVMGAAFDRVVSEMRAE